MRVDAFRPASEFKENMDTWLRRFRTAKPIEGEERVLIPGDPEREMEQTRLEQGIPLLVPVAEDLQKLAQKFNITFELMQ
jgi:LDH2 family malate/lactate/ureidoglycolate dehydrogenase